MAMPNESSNSPSSNLGNAETVIGIIPEPSEAVTSHSESHSPPSPAGRGTECGIPIPSRLESNGYAHHTAGCDSHRTGSTGPNSWKTTSQTPSSWDRTSILLNGDEVLSNGADDQSDRGTDVASVAGLSYARKRRLLRRMSRSNLPISKQGMHSVKERWTKKLEDFRQYEVGLLRSLLPLKAGVAAALAGCLAFAPVPTIFNYYGVVAALGVDWSLESNVGLTLQKGYNLMLGSGLAGLCALAVHLIEPYTGSFRVYYLVTCVFLGGFVPRCISLPKILKTRWSQTTYFYVFIFHILILNQMIKIVHIAQFLLNCLCYTFGFVTVLFLILCIKPDYAGDALLVLLVSDFHTTGVVLERIVETYKGGVVLTKIQELLSGVVREDHIHHDLQYIMKSTGQVEQLMNAAKWEPSHGKFFKGYPWDLYPTLLAMLIHVMYDLIALDSTLRAEIQAPLEIRLLFAEDMERVARECSMLFHSLGDALLEHKNIDYHSNVKRAQEATLNLRKKLIELSAAVISQDALLPPSCNMTRNASYEFVHEACEQLPVPTPPPSPKNAKRDKVIQQDLETSQKLNLEEGDWKVRLFTRRRSIYENWEETQQQISSLSFIKFASILIELMGKVKGLVAIVDQLSEKARFTDVTS